MKKSFCFIIAALGWALPGFPGFTHAQEMSLVTRVFPVQPSAFETVVTRGGDDHGGGAFVEIGGKEEPEARSDVKKFFEDMGVPFPPGTSITFNPTISSLVVRNTPENMEIMDRVLSHICVIPSQVQIDFVFVSFAKEQIETLARKNPGALVGQDDVLGLWKAGKGILESSGQILTRTGLNAIWESVEEVIYPSEYEADSAGSPSNALPAVQSVSGIVPGSFETREIGTIVNVTPTVGPDGYTIELTLSPELCDQLESIDYGFSFQDDQGRTRQVKLEQPVFYSRNVTTSIVIWDGETIVMGATDHKGEDRLTFLLITARVLDPEGKPNSSRQEDERLAARERFIEKDGWSTRIYPVQPSSTDGSIVTRGDDRQEWGDVKKFFEDMGLSFPAGASIAFNPTISSLIVRNTVENLVIFERVLMTINVIPTQVEIDLSFVEFDTAGVESAMRNGAAPSPEQDTMKSLWQAGKGRWLGYSKVVTRTGLNAIYESVREIIYPSEFEVPESRAFTNDASTRVETPMRIPGSFETREVGIISNVTPTVGPDGYTIELTLSPEWCPDPSWEELEMSVFDARGRQHRMPVKQPRFDSRNLTTSVVLSDGSTVVMGGVEQGNRAKTVYTFLTARILGPDGKRVRKEEK